MEFSNYIKKANDHIALVLMIEDKEGVEQIESIVQVPGVDAIMIGPYDLSGSYDKLGQIEDVEVQKGIEKVRVACRKFDKPLGIFALEANQGKIYLAQGYQFLVVGMDVHYLWSKAKEISDTVQSSH